MEEPLPEFLLPTGFKAPNNLDKTIGALDTKATVTDTESIPKDVLPSDYNLAKSIEFDNGEPSASFEGLKSNSEADVKKVEIVEESLPTDLLPTGFNDVEISTTLNSLDADNEDRVAFTVSQEAIPSSLLPTGGIFFHVPDSSRKESRSEFIIFLLLFFKLNGCLYNSLFFFFDTFSLASGLFEQT